MTSSDKTDGPLVTKQRLEPHPGERQIRPWSRAQNLTRCFLYWIPVHSFPVPALQRDWLLTFLDRWGRVAAKQLSLRAELFLQLQSVQPNLSDALVKCAPDFNPVFGLSRRPGGGLPPLPTQQDVKAMQRGEKAFSFSDYAGDYCYWFLAGAEDKQRALFFGQGGLTTLYLKPGPAPAVPKVRLPKAMQEHPFFKDADEKMAAASRLSSPFLKKSKELFGAGLESSPQYPGILFIVPLLASADFFSRPEEEVKSWFDLFDIYVRESPVDRGILLATKPDLEEAMAEIVREMKAEGMEYR
ncbi:MAG TPA: hypothetical protein VKR60_15545 [Candidatus Sulfotelmatobacter sp.]|nr:hypothetical protein [Candidatus Sulfotelmatobacter sp.]